MNSISRLPNQYLLVAVVAFVVALVAATGCNSGRTDRSTTNQYTDDIGRVVDIKVPATRIVTLAPNLTEIVFAAGAGEALVGVTTADNYPPEVDSISRVAAVPIDFEAVTRLRPHVVLATDQVNSPKDAATFESLGIPIYFFHFDELEDIFRATEVIGTLAGTATRAESHASSLREAMQDLRTRTRAISITPRVLFLISEEKLFGFGQGSYVHEVIEAAGGESVSKDEKLSAPIFSDEYVVDRDPDVIIGSFDESVDAAELLRLHPAWRTVAAVRDNRILAINPDLILRPGPRVVEGAYRIALLLHPDLFGSRSPAPSR